ncbi:hypothetical protein Rsub_01026 [Raphidocelis subcapitata]|uniref:Uncharacterized protein n=1 Tax=Raphidocelis subcapitata TaxID=307507 RepID=A0A2V0NLL1_9CHLO|nr:hypothetical protein Rsub_01026 [Raphidocelis subcapitata]|eukprot:GBF88314.1 hypothetical protein Rsub_01026 [Raphidocelis subcapitata]
MALRGLARHLRPLVPQGVRLAQSAPTVFDKMVQFYVIDKSGTRHTVRGIEGNSLAAALRETGTFSDEFFLPHPMDPAATDCHVYVGNDYLDRLPTLSDAQSEEQRRVVDDYVRAAARPNSRMAYYIRLGPQLNGMTVALGPVEPWRVE